MAESSHTLLRRPVVWAWLFFSSMFLLTSGGRMGNADAFSQLQSSMVLVTTGRVSLPEPISPEFYWMPSPSGQFYQAHDPGNLVAFLPAAAAGAAVSSPQAVQIVQEPPLVSRVCAGLMYALMGGVIGSVLFATFRLTYSTRLAFLLAVLACTGTPIWAYTRSTMDVLGGCLGIALLVYVLLQHSSGSMTTDRAGVLSGVAVTLACWFRFSLLPFTAPAALAALVLNEPRHKARVGFVFATILAFGMLPVFWYNYVRLGNPLAPATRAPQYAEQNALDGDPVVGMYGLYLSPNHGLIVFAPTTALAMAAPFMLQERSWGFRVTFIVLGLGLAVYSVLIASMTQWAKVEWGPRYLVPLLPVVLVPAAHVGVELWRSKLKPVVAVLVVGSIVAGLPAAVVNYNVVVAYYPGAADPLSPSPRQIIGAYDALWAGLHGQEQEVPPEVAADVERSAGRRFPDFWTVRLIERGGVARVGGFVVALTLTLGAAYAAVMLARDRSVTA